MSFAYLTEKNLCFDHLFPDKGRKALRVGALPTVNLPERSHQAKYVLPRRPLTIVDQNSQNATKKD